MHLVMILAALGLATCARLVEFSPAKTWTERWEQSLFLFLFSPLLLLITALAVLCMGPRGQMLGLSAGWFSYWLALGFIGSAVIFCLTLATQVWKSLQRVRSCQQIDLNGRTARLIDNPVLFSAQIGFWQSELVIAKGLLKALSREQLDAVLTHERAHYYYRDSFWFFWLGWLRRITTWLPNTEALWQELLLLRELRADRRSAEQIDALLLAETLLLVASNPVTISEDFWAAFSCAAPKNRLTERIEALLAEPESSAPSNYWSWHWLILVFLPLVTVPFHR